MTSSPARRARSSSRPTRINNDSENLQSDATLLSGDKQQIARDAFYALSVAFRIELEALALIPIIVIQAVRGLPTAPRDLTYKTHLKLVQQVWLMPSYVAGIKQSFTRQAELLDRMTSNLAKALKTDVNKSPGMELGESVVDQIVGITLDSFRIDLKAGGEMFIFSSIGTGDRNGDDYDFRGRKFKLDYRVQPIVLASARLDIVLDWIRMPGAANLGFGYATDRVYRSGGKIEQSPLVDQLGIDGVASDVIDAGLGLLGIRSSVRVASFTSGRVNQVQATNIDSVVASAPLQPQVHAGRRRLRPALAHPRRLDPRLHRGARRRRPLPPLHAAAHRLRAPGHGRERQRALHVRARDAARSRSRTSSGCSPRTRASASARARAGRRSSISASPAASARRSSTSSRIRRSPTRRRIATTRRRSRSA